jgi:two-component system chemotaxis response regulator CheY
MKNIMQNRSCLVVDDSPVVRRAARRIVEGLGFTVREAKDGAEALVSCRTDMPEAVLLDWNMPVMDGLEFLKHVRAEHGPSQPIVVLCTTEAGIDRIVEALAAGAQEYIMKPFDKEILVSKFQEVGLV